ncbi:hypothetical protein GTQ40_13440 [Flavobacteriaceae bacterium R38]|nr:hypothetical protein [Flavobacteriaceae bacterium R38]
MKTNSPIKLAFVFFCLINLIGCSNKSAEEKIQNKIKPINIDSLYNEYKSEVSFYNKSLITTLFDSVSKKSINLVLKDRVYPKNQGNIPSLENTTLDSINTKFKDDNEHIDSVKAYINRFIQLRSTLLNEDLVSKENFNLITDSILKSDVYKNHILKEWAQDSLYISLSNNIQSDILITQNKHRKILSLEDWKLKERIENQPQEVNPISEEDSSGFTFYLKKYSLLLFIVFFISFLVNILLSSYINKLKQKNIDLKQEIELNKKESIKPISKKVPEVELTNQDLDKEFQELETILNNKFHRDCVNTQQKQLVLDKEQLLDDAKLKKFSNQEELRQFLSKKMQEIRSTLEQEIKQYVDKTNAENKINNTVDAQHFISKFSSPIISSEDIISKVKRLNQNLVDEIPRVILIDDLNNRIDKHIHDVENVIEKLIEENSLLYFPFADARGTLSDDKKSKTRELDSAIKLTLSPNNNQSARFQLIYDYTEMMQAGIQSYDVLLLPICNLKNEHFNRSGTQIVQLGEDGEMVLENGRWSVTKKLSIKVI